MALIEALTLAALSAVTPADTVPFVLVRMGLSVHVQYGQDSVAGIEQLCLRNVARHAVSEVPLLLNRLMTLAGATAVDGTPLAARQDVVVFADDSTWRVNAAVVRLARPIEPGDTVSIVLRYGGRLAGYAETGSLYIRDHVEHDFTILRADAFAFPVLGVPSWRVNRSAVREPFLFAADVTVPPDLVVATSGRIIGRHREGSLATWEYRGEEPVPFLNIAIAPYDTLDQGEARIFFFPRDSTGARMLGRAATAALERYAQWYGSPSRASHLTIIEIPEGWGSQASLTGGIIQTADAFRDGAERYQLYHELSHVFNPSDLDRPSPRWNEGLASFLQWRMAGALDGWDDWDARIDRIAQSLKQRCGSDRACATIPFADYGKAGLTDLSYSVGAVMFYLLYRSLGPDTFDRAYRDFWQRHRESGATSRDLVASFERASPRSHRIFTDWFYTTTWYQRVMTATSMRQVVAEYTR